MIPLGVASPCSPVARVDLPQVQPPPTRTVRACGSTWTRFIGERSMHEPVVDVPEAGAVVAAAADGDQQLVLAGEGDRRGHVRPASRIVRSAPAACRSSRCRPPAPRRTGVVRADQLTTEARELAAGSVGG